MSFSWLWVVQLSEIWRDQSISFFSCVNSKLVEEPYIYGIFPETWKISKVGEISFRTDIFRGFIKNTFPILTQTSMFVLAIPYSDAGEKKYKKKKMQNPIASLLSLKVVSATVSGQLLPRNIAPRLGLGFALGFALGRIFLEDNFPRTVSYIFASLLFFYFTSKAFFVFQIIDFKENL